MGSSELLLPIVNSCSPEMLRLAALTISESAPTLAVRVGINPATELTRRPPSWMSGVGYVESHFEAGVDRLSPKAIMALTGNPCENKGLWVDIAALSVQNTPLTRQRPSHYFSGDEFVIEAVAGIHGYEPEDYTHESHSLLWQIVGSTVINGEIYDADARFKTGGGGGVLSLKKPFEDPK